MLLFASLAQSVANAHGLGQSFEKEVGDYIIEFEYDSLEVVSGEVVPYVFRLIDKESKGAVAFDSMFLRVEEKDSKEVKFAGPIAHDAILDGAARTSITLNDGTYIFSFYFKRGEEQLAEIEFEQLVSAGDDSNKSWGLSQISSFLAGGLIVYFALKFKRGKRD